MSQETWYLYVLECNNGALYTGITTDVERRYKEHYNGVGAKYTKANPPIALKVVVQQENRSVATKAEIAFKALTLKKKLEKIKEWKGALINDADNEND